MPTEAGDAIAELIAEHSRELEARSAELRKAVAELERRETRARELHARVEKVLREGSAELDVRHSDLSVRAEELDRREAAIAEREAHVEARARDLGAVELRRAAIERREEALADREAELERRERSTREREEELGRREQAVREREEELDRRVAELAETAASLPRAAAPPSPQDGHVAFTIENGYRLLEREGVPPDVGDTVELDDGLHRCVRLTVSPFPDDRRRCAVLEWVSPLAPRHA